MFDIIISLVCKFPRNSLTLKKIQSSIRDILLFMNHALICYEYKKKEKNDSLVGNKNSSLCIFPNNFFIIFIIIM